MKYLIWFVLLLLLFTAPGIAQTKTKFKFTSINQLGILTGESLSEFQMQSVNGVSYKGFVAGIGLGVDDYYQRSFPLFYRPEKKLFQKRKCTVYLCRCGLFIYKQEFDDRMGDGQGRRCLLCGRNWL